MAMRSDAGDPDLSGQRTALARAFPTRLDSSQLQRLALFALFVVGMAELAQTGATFFGRAQLLWYHQDFPAFYTAAHFVANGGGSLIYDTAAVAQGELALAGGPVGGTGVLAYFNPPFFALLMAPLSGLSLDRAYQVWTLINLALLGANAWMLWRISAPLARSSRWLLLAAFLTLFPVSYGLHQGQFSLILATSWMSAFLLLRSGRDRWAGVALAPLLIKPELLLLVAAYLLWKRRWRVFSTLVPLAGAAVAVSLGVVGLAAAIDYPAYLLRSTTPAGVGGTSRLMFSWTGIVAMFWDHPGTLGATAAFAALALATLAGVMHALRGAFAPRSERFALQWLLLTLATILVDPHLYLQDTILIALPAAALLCSSPAGQRYRIALAIAGGWAALAFGTFPNEHLGIDVFGLYAVAAAGALLVMNSRYYGKCAPCVKPWLVAAS